MNNDTPSRRQTLQSSPRPATGRPSVVVPDRSALQRQPTPVLRPAPQAPTASIAAQPSVDVVAPTAIEQPPVSAPHVTTATSLPPPLPVEPIFVSPSTPVTSPAAQRAVLRPPLPQPMQQSKVMGNDITAPRATKPTRVTNTSPTDEPDFASWDAGGAAATPKASVDPDVKKRDKETTKKGFFRKLFTRRTTLHVLAVIVLGATAYIGVDAWLANSKLQARLSTPTAQAASVELGKQSQANEGKDTAPLADDAVSSYAVAADLPRVLSIDKLNVVARILPMGVNKDNSMQAPTNINDSGWYDGSAKPGQPGAVVIDGHASATDASAYLGLFNALDSLNTGDIVTIERGDGTKFSYKVTFKETVALDAVDMKKALLPHGDATEGLNLITCAGQWTDDGATLDHRTIVYTQRIA